MGWLEGMLVGLVTGGFIGEVILPVVAHWLVDGRR